MAILKNHHLFVGMFRQKRIISLSVFFAKRKHIPVKGQLLPVKPFRAITAHILPGLTVACKDPFGNTPKAQGGGHIQEKHRIAVLQPVGDGAVKVAVNDP